MALVATAAFGPPALAVGEVHEVAALTAPNAGAGDYFGFPVAVEGDTAVVGAIYADVGDVTDSGAAYVFVRSGGVWTQTAVLVADDAAAGDGFGYAVAVNGGTIAVGAIYAEHNGVTGAGAVYVFELSDGIWSQAAKLTAGDPADGDFFGGSLALVGDTLAIGALYVDHYSGRPDVGAVYVFDRISGVWYQSDKLMALDVGAGDVFGIALALEPDTLLIGAAYADLGSAADAGAAYIFTRANGYWTQSTKLSAVDAAAGDFFGAAVALSGDTAIIGAYSNDAAGIVDAGSSYVFDRSDGIWTQTAKLTVTDAAVGDGFGISAALEGDKAVIGAYFVDLAGGARVDAGAAYIFSRSGGTWRQTTKLTASDSASGDLFGIYAALSGTTILIGAPNSDHTGVADAGAAYAFDVRSITGDLNCDSTVNYADINAFILALGGQSAYELRYPACRWMNADTNRDGLVNYADINPFVRLLAAP